MFKIIVGVDDRDEALDALALAGEIGRLEDAEVTAAASFVFSGGHLDLAYPEARKAFLGETEARATSALGDVPHRHVEVQDSPAHGLQRLAEEMGADLIVIGSTHRGPIGRVLPGSVGELLLAGAPCPILVAPRGYAAGERGAIKRIGVGYDGMPESDLALSEAIRLAKRAGAKLEVVTVAPDYDPMLDSSVESLRDRCLDRMTNAVRAGRERGLDADGVLPDAEAAEALVDHAAEVDLLVLGSRGYGPLRHVLLGSTSARVIRNAPTPVMVVPRGAQERVREHAAGAADAVSP